VWSIQSNASHPDQKNLDWLTDRNRLESFEQTPQQRCDQVHLIELSILLLISPNVEQVHDHGDFSLPRLSNRCQEEAQQVLHL